MALPLPGEPQRASEAGPSLLPATTRLRACSTAGARPPEGSYPPQTPSSLPARQHTATAAAAAAAAPAEQVSMGTAGVPGVAAAAGFHCWLREWRAKRDSFGLSLWLVFHIVILKKQWALLPLSHVVYCLAYSTLMAVLLVWQRRPQSSYAAWREWVQAAIQLDIFFNPCHLTLWRLTVSIPPPALLADWPGLNALLTLPPAVINTMSIHLLLFPFAHALALPVQVAVQLANVVRVLWGIPEGCASIFYSHPFSQRVVHELHSWLGFTFFMLSMSPVSELPSKARATGQQCRQVGSFLVLLSGLVVQLTLQACWERRMFVEYCAQRARQRQQLAGSSGAAAISGAAAAAAAEGPQQGLPTALDRWSVWLAGLLAGVVSSPVALPVITILLWEAVAVVLDIMY